MIKIDATKSFLKLKLFEQAMALRGVAEICNLAIFELIQSGTETERDEIETAMNDIVGVEPVERNTLN